jgi:hypothetical protein
VQFPAPLRRAIFLGIGFKFNDFIQAIHRIQRFLQTKPVRIELIYSEAERSVRAVLEGKWKRHAEMCVRMSEIIRTYGLGLKGVDTVARSLEDGTGAQVAREPRLDGRRNDTIIETAAMPSDSVGLIVTSIPFATQYEYTPSYNDLGHTDDSDHFFRQLDYLTPELKRVLMPGRKLACTSRTGCGRAGWRASASRRSTRSTPSASSHYRRHGLFYMGMITVETDVVRENNQTYRLGWTEKCKDGSRMSVGMPEYVLLFRKAPSSSEDGYADEPVVHSKAAYTRARWQTDAHAKWRSSGERLIGPEDLVGLPARDVYRRFRDSVRSRASTITSGTSRSRRRWRMRSRFRPASPCCRRTPGTPRSGATSRGCARSTASRRPRGAKCTSARCSSTSSTG